MQEIGARACIPVVRSPGTPSQSSVIIEHPKITRTNSRSQSNQKFGILPIILLSFHVSIIHLDSALLSNAINCVIILFN